MSSFPSWPKYIQTFLLPCSGPVTYLLCINHGFFPAFQCRREDIFILSSEVLFQQCNLHCDSFSICVLQRVLYLENMAVKLLKILQKDSYSFVCGGEIARKLWKSAPVDFNSVWIPTLLKNIQDFLECLLISNKISADNYEVPNSVCKKYFLSYLVLSDGLRPVSFLWSKPIISPHKICGAC